MAPSFWFRDRGLPSNDVGIYSSAFVLFPDTFVRVSGQTYQTDGNYTWNTDAFNRIQ